MVKSLIIISGLALSDTYAGWFNDDLPTIEKNLKDSLTILKNDPGNTSTREDLLELADEYIEEGGIIEEEYKIANDVLMSNRYYSNLWNDSLYSWTDMNPNSNSYKISKREINKTYKVEKK